MQDYIRQEDGFGRILLEDGSGALTPGTATAYIGGREFDGVDDFDSVALNLSAETKITQSFWLAQKAHVGGNTMAFEFTANVTTNAGAFEMNADWSPADRTLFLMSSSSGNYLGRSVPNPAAGTLNHWLVIWDRPGSSITVYINGVLQTTTNEGGAGSFNSSSLFANSTLYIMSRAGSSLFDPGVLARSGLWGSGVTLTSDERTALANGYSPSYVHPTGLLDERYLSAANGAAAVSCTLVRNRALSASSTGTASVSCAIVRTRARSASSAGASSVSCSLVRVRARSAAVSAGATVSAAVVRVRARDASASGSATVSCSVVRLRGLTAAVSASASVSCTIVRTRAHAVSISSAASVSCAIVRTRALSASPTGSASVACSVVRTRTLDAAVSSSASVSAALSRDRHLTATIDAFATVTGELAQAPFGAGTAGVIRFSTSGFIPLPLEGPLSTPTRPITSRTGEGHIDPPLVGVIAED